jgi:hypothetical protein
MLPNSDNEVLYVLCFSSIIIRVNKYRRLRWSGNVACVGARRGPYRVLVEKHERRSLEKSRRRWEDKIKMNFEDVKIWLTIRTCGERFLFR